MVKRKCIGFMLAAAIVGSSLMTTTNQVSAYNNESLDTAQSIAREVSIPYHAVNKNDSKQMAELDEYLKSRKERGYVIRETISEAGNVMYEILYDVYSDGEGNIIDAKIERRIELVEIKNDEEKINLPAEGTTGRYKQSEMDAIPELKAQINGYINYANSSSEFEVVETTFREEGRLIRRMDINKIRKGRPGSDFYCAIEIEHVAISSDWDNQDGQWHYYDENGNLIKGFAMAEWNGVEEKYYFDEEGHMVSNKWIKVDGKWYFCQKGVAVATKWLNEGNVWYYLNDEGVMQTGWLNINGKWYFLEPYGAMATGWKFIDNNWYYLNADGTMATSKLIDGKVTEDGNEIVVQYKVDAHGVWDGKTIYPGGIIK